MTTAPVVRSLEVVSVVEQVTVEIRRSIMSGALKPGQEFSLRQIAEQLGVSLIPVREALRHLENQGLVITRRSKSAMVAPLVTDEIRGIYRLRLMLEPELAGRACALLQPADFERLDVLQQVHASTVDLDARNEAHHRFHVEMLRPVATAWDERMLDILWYASERYVRYAFASRDDDPAEAVRRGRAHVVLLDAMRTRDPSVAAAAYVDHLSYTSEVVVATIEQLAAVDAGTAPAGRR